MNRHTMIEARGYDRVDGRSAYACATKKTTASPKAGFAGLSAAVLY